MSERASEQGAPEPSPYKAGFMDGVRAYAHWRNGQQEVGTTGTTLKDALANVEQTWNYAHEADAARAGYVREEDARAAVEALRRIADEESGWRFKVDPLEHARSVIEEMREVASDALRRLAKGEP